MVEKIDALSELKQILLEYALENGFKLNPDPRTISIVIGGLIKNRAKYGEFICPCRPTEITGDMEKDKNIICPCIYHKDEIKINGACRCRLFVSNEYFAETEIMLEEIKEI